MTDGKDWFAPCSDHHCVMNHGERSRGLGTNGGCEHLKLRPREYVTLLANLRAELCFARDVARQRAVQLNSVSVERDAYRAHFEAVTRDVRDARAALSDALAEAEAERRRRQIAEDTVYALAGAAVEPTTGR